VSPDDPIDRLPGAGKVTSARLAARGLLTVRDLVYLLPRAYQDFRRTYGLAELSSLTAGTPVVVRGRVVRLHKFFRRMLDVMIEQDGAILRARWFRPNAGMSETYAKGTQVALAGSLRRTPTGEHQLVHPSNVTALVGEDGGLGIRPRYPLVENVPGRTLEKIVAAAVVAVGNELVDVLPADLRARLGFPELAQALRDLHQPPPTLAPEEFAALAQGSSAAHRRLAFEDLFLTQVGLARERNATRCRQAWACSGDGEGMLLALRPALPFACTAAQERAIGVIAEALRGPSPMQCLLQGDVGSGKTVVVFAACLQAARAGGQCLLMAPTAVLAEQHSQTLAAWGRAVGLSTALLHAGLPALEQRRVLDAAAAGEVDLIVGTHALLEERLRLQRLVLAVVDEQHRFGVRQRARLRRVGGRENNWQIGAQDGMVPHLLVLSATPIPRTLALTTYGDLDLVTLDGVPSGRKPVATSVCTWDHGRDQAYRAVTDAVAAGGQAFVVCPAIAEGEGSRSVSVLALAERLRGTLAPARIGVLHGRLSSVEQRGIVDSFRAGALDVLVSTTVLEVGIDVPSARVMVIEDSERFGLSQLHQLRGRVGRGPEPGRCFLVTRSSDPEALRRLHLLAATHDGFRVASEDLRQRGAGDLQGTRQTGTPELCVADLGAYVELLELARGEALRVLASDPELTQPTHAELRRRVVLRWEQARPIAEEAG
jgi:ATP-dependent DNA helicase RecG